MRGGLRRLLTQLASTPDGDLTRNKLPLLHRSLLPVLSLASSLYGLSLLIRRNLYRWGLLRKHRLPVPVISVGNLTWGGNGKTPMTEFLARFFTRSGISPLILTRGYAGGDEAAMLHRHLSSTPARVGVGANRVAVAASFFERYGYVCYSNILLEEFSSMRKYETNSVENKIGVAILDDGMQHLSLSRDVDIIMVNGMMPWGNGHLLPRGTLREPLDAIKRADIGVIHHADLVSDKQLKAIEKTMLNIKGTLPIFLSRLGPSCFFDIQNVHTVLPLRMVENTVVLCVSAIGFPSAFSLGIKKLGPLHVDRLDFIDHYFIQPDMCYIETNSLSGCIICSFYVKMKVQLSDGMHLYFVTSPPTERPLQILTDNLLDIELIKQRLKMLENKFRTRTVVVVTEKDYDRDPAIFKKLDEFRVLVACSSLEIMPSAGRTIEIFEKLLMKLLQREIVDTDCQ